MSNSGAILDGSQRWRRLLLDALSRNDLSDAQSLVSSVVDMHEKAFALSQAVKEANLAAVAAFLDAGSDPLLKHQGRTALVSAVCRDNFDCLHVLLDRYLPLSKYAISVKAEQRVRSRVRLTINEALFESAAVCSTQCLKYLLDVGADCNSYFYHDDEFLSWCTPLIAACYGPLSPVCRSISLECATSTALMLIEYGANINNINHMGDTALHWAASSALEDVVGVLLRNGADVNHQNKFGKTSLMLLCENFKEDKSEMFLRIARRLLQQTPDLTLTDQDGWLPLHFALESVGLLMVLLEGGVDPNLLPSEDCTSCLSLAASQNRTAAVKLLVQYNARPQSGALSPFYGACNCQNLEMAGILYAAGVRHSDVCYAIETSLDTSVVSPVSREGWEELRAVARHPATLLHQCRTLIRRCLGPGTVHGLLDLPLPHFLIRYLQLDL